MPKDITTVLKEATKDMLSEQTLTEIKSAYDAAVNNAGEERAKLAVESALDKQDADYSSKLEKLLAAVDADHANKLNRVVEAIDVNHSEKLKKIITIYEKAINEDAKNFKTNVVDKLDKYLDLYLEEKIPTATVIEAVENVRAAKIVDQMRTLLGIDLAMATQSIREAVLDGKAQLDEYKAALDKANSKLATVSESLKTTTAELLVEKKTASFADDKKSYMKKMLTGRDEQYITENFDYVLNLFDKNEEESTTLLKEQATTQVESLKVDASKPVIEESAEASKPGDPMFNMYLNELKKA
jgi:hypothetical protein